MEGTVSIPQRNGKRDIVPFYSVGNDILSDLLFLDHVCNAIYSEPVGKKKWKLSRAAPLSTKPAAKADENPALRRNDSVTNDINDCPTENHGRRHKSFYATQVWVSDSQRLDLSLDSAGTASIHVCRKWPSSLWTGYRSRTIFCQDEFEIRFRYRCGLDRRNDDEAANLRLALKSMHCRQLKRILQLGRSRIESTVPSP